MGSLFDGIGGFPLAARMTGITPLWASEIEAAPISITKLHFPEMKHLGDITKINGAEIEPVDVITFGSPCQDLSVAGKREGLRGTRSGLFSEAVRIIKEMRKATNGKYPARIIWENVPGALSSNKGEDFKTVLEKIANIREGRVTIPKPKKWQKAGAIVGDNYSLAWRTLDAQYWGIPQRRKRIFLIADFGGESTGEILFKPDSLSWNIAESGEERERITRDTKKDFGETGFGCWQEGIQCLRGEGENRPSRPSNVIVEGVDGYNQNITGKETNTLRGGRNDKDNIPLVILNDQCGSTINIEKKEINPTLKNNKGHEPIILENHPADSRIKINEDGIVQTLSFQMGTGGGNVPMVYCMASQLQSKSVMKDKSPTIMASCNKEPNCVFTFKSFGEYKEDHISQTRKARNDLTSEDLILDHLIRRLTPLECERLMGYPDYWTQYGHNGKQISDSARYKALGNSVAIPCVFFIFTRIKNQFIKEEAT